MKWTARHGAWLLPLVLTGCFHMPHKAKNTPVAPSLPPPSSVNTVPVELPPSATTIPPQPTETAQTPTRSTQKPPARRKPSKPQPAPPTEVASNAPPPVPAVSAIGQLSSGDPAGYRNETEDSIVSIEKALNGINRSLSDSEQKTADHIREFLKQARQALGTGDIDGAHNLAAKAKVLLDELTK